MTGREGRTGWLAGERLERTVGLRVLYRPGVVRLLRVGAMVLFLVQVGFYITILRPDLIDQTAIGQDASNYFAAGQRLNDGHELYRLSPGDRPVPLLPPPNSQAPILSPPLLGVVWRPLALLGDPAMVLWGLAGTVALGAVTIWMIANGSRRRLAIITGLGLFIAESMWSGNVNPFIVCLVIGVWAASSRGHASAAGALVAIAAGLKLTPVYLAWWLLVRRDWPALRGFLLAAAVLAAVSLAGAGLDSHFEFLRVARETATDGASPWSVAGFIRNWGVPVEVAAMSTIGWTVACAAAVWLLRRRPQLSYAAAVLMVLYSSPVVLIGHLGLLLATTAPYPASRQPAPGAVVAGPAPGMPAARPAGAS